MTYNLRLAWRNIRTHAVQSLVSVLVVALGIGLSIAVFALGDGVRAGIVQASDPFGVLVVGPKGSAQQLVINTLLLQDVPLGNVSHQIYDDLKADDRVRLAVPLAMGDNVGGAPIIGTDLSFFELRPALNEPPSFQVAEGRLFEAPEVDEHEHEGEDHDEHEGDEHEGEEHEDEHHHDETFEAVLGSEAAASTGLTLGDTFRGAHGVGHVSLESDVHEEVYEVVGILAPSRTPYDAAVFTPIETVWSVHHHHDEEGEEAGPGTALVEAEDTAAEENSVTAILVQPVGFGEANSLWQTFYTSTDAQAAFPGQELGALFDLLGQAEQVLNGVGYLVLIVAALTVFLAIYSATVSREQAIAIMRSLGSSRASIFWMVILEALIVTVLGALLGRLLGYGTAALIARIFTVRSAIPIPIHFLAGIEPVLWLLTIAVAVLAGALPASLAYRVNVVEKLFPT